MGSYGIAAEEELHLTEKLFWGIFDSLSHKVKIVIPVKIEINIENITIIMADTNHRKYLF